MEPDEFVVVSEVNTYTKQSHITLDNGRKTVLSRYDFTYPEVLIDEAIGSLQPQIDEEGDLEVKRIHSSKSKDGIILIEHQNSTTLDLVGEQVWRGSLFLADYVFHNSMVFRGANVLELAAGVGLTSVVASMFARKVVATDIERGEILQLLKRNLKRNQEATSAETFVKVVDFFDGGSLEAIRGLVEDTEIVLVADVIYNDNLTDAFFETLKLLMKPGRIFVIALEKRYVFTMEDLDTVAPCYEHFLTRLQALNGLVDSDLSVDEIPQQDIPQYFAYERTKELVIWKISANG